MSNNLLKNKKASLWCVKDKNQTSLFSALWIFDNKRAYYYLGSKNSNSENNSSSAGTIILYESIKKLYYSPNLLY